MIPLGRLFRTLKSKSRWTAWRYARIVTIWRNAWCSLGLLLMTWHRSISFSHTRIRRFSTADAVPRSQVQAFPRVLEKSHRPTLSELQFRCRRGSFWECRSSDPWSSAYWYAWQRSKSACQRLPLRLLVVRVSQVTGSMSRVWSKEFACWDELWSEARVFRLKVSLLLNLSYWDITESSERYDPNLSMLRTSVFQGLFSGTRKLKFGFQAVNWPPFGRLSRWGCSGTCGSFCKPISSTSKYIRHLQGMVLAQKVGNDFLRLYLFGDHQFLYLLWRLWLNRKVP